MPELGVIMVVVAVLVAVGALLLWALRVKSPATVDDLYLEALEAWSAGDLQLAEENLRKSVAADPQGVDSFLKLGDLLRLRGRPDKASALHRGLIARADLPANRRVQAGLSLAEDMLAMTRYHEAGQVLDTLVRHAGASARYWQARFVQWAGLGDAREAAKALKFAGDHLPDGEAGTFRESYGYYQLDRAFAAALDHEHSTAAALCKNIPAGSTAAGLEPLVRAVIRVGKGDTDGAMNIAASSLADQPQALLAFQAVLRPALLEQGQFTRAIPLLERIVQQQEVPVPLVMELALLYEKTGRLEQAIDLLVSQKDRRDLTCGSGSALLNILIRQRGDADLRRLWDAFHHPEAGAGWYCPACGARRERCGWFCPSCLNCGPFLHGAEDRQGEPW